MDTWRGMWIHVCGVGGKRPCAISTDILEFRLIGVHVRIGTVRSSRSTLISYSRQPSLRACIANHWEINDLGKALHLMRLPVPYARLRSPPAQSGKRFQDIRDRMRAARQKGSGTII